MTSQTPAPGKVALELSKADLEKLSDKVYRLMQRDLRLELARAGQSGAGRR